MIALFIDKQVSIWSYQNLALLKPILQSILVPLASGYVYSDDDKWFNKQK